MVTPLLPSPTFILSLSGFLSGAAALFYEILWARAFAELLGSTVQAAALTFAAFLSGLAAGAWLLGRYSSTWRHPAPVYALVEAGIALLAVSIGLILHRQADTIIPHLGAGESRGAVIFALVFFATLPATLLLGGTLPILLTLGRRLALQRFWIGRLYGFNLLGAATGAVTCGFFTIRLWGIENSYAIAGGANLAAGALVLFFLRHPQPSLPATEPADRAAIHPTTEWWLLASAGISGLLVLGMEVVWSRFAAFLLGNRVFAFATLLFAVLMLLAAGSLLSARIHRRWPDTPLTPLAWIFCLAALGSILSTGGAAWWIARQPRLETAWPAFDNLFPFYRFVEVCLLLAPVLIPLGILFPLALAGSRRALKNIGPLTGRFYLVNTIGTVTGSLGVGFWGMNHFGAFGSARLLTIVTLLFTILLWIERVWRRGADIREHLPLALVVLVTIPLLNTLPSRFPPALEPGEKQLFEREDPYGLFRVVRRVNGDLKVTNNRTELVFHLGSPATSRVQQMQGHLGPWFFPAARTALVLGSGYGITAGALAAHANIRRVDAVEILPAMIAAAPLFQPHHMNHHVNVKVHLHQDDGRHFLARSRQRYDIIAVTVSDPRLPGGSGLYHRDFLELAKTRLNKNGVLIHHAFGNGRTTILATLRAVFPHLLLTRAYGNGFLVVAADHPLPLPEQRRMIFPMNARLAMAAARGRQHLAIPRFQTLNRVTIDPTTAIASDDRPLLEFDLSGYGPDLLFSNQ